jgi:hypothetical protein
VGEHPELLHALVLADLVEVLPVDARVGNGVDQGRLPCSGQFRHEGQDVAGRRVARGHEREIHQPVADRVEGARRRRRMLGQHGELDAAVGRLLDLGGPALEHHARQMMLGRHPRRHGEGGLGGRGRRRGEEGQQSEQECPQVWHLVLPVRSRQRLAAG